MQLLKNKGERSRRKREAEKLRKLLLDQYATCSYNVGRINWVIDNIYYKQRLSVNRWEDTVHEYLLQHGISNIKPQAPIPILKEGGIIDHLYIADFLIDDFIIVEVDGRQHEKIYDDYRDNQTTSKGYFTVRISTTDLSIEGLKQLLIDIRSLQSQKKN